MRILNVVLARRRLIIATALLLALTGILSWITMPREEDPQFPRRDAMVLVPFPGADAETVERLLIEPIEEHLAEVEEIHAMHATARAGIGIVHLELHETVYETDDAWDDVREALADAERDFPAEAGRWTLDDDLISQEAVVLSISGSEDPLVLADAAETAKKRLLAIRPVREVKIVGDPGEQITIEWDDTTARRLQIDPAMLVHQLGNRSRIVPGGVIHLGAKTATLRPETDFASVEEIAATPILLPSGSSVPLGVLARVRRGPAEPAAERMRWNGELSVGLGLVPADGIDRVRFGAEVREVVAELATELEPLVIEEVVFQPDQVELRLTDLGRSLMLGIVIVALVLLVSMGPRLGFLVASVVPLVAFGSIALFAMGGGILHQISIAAVVIALGMLVDNAIVVAENIQWRLDRGEPVDHASVGTIKELAAPLGAATGTTLAAFIPMLISSGNTADFTRAIPTLILLTLTVSYVFAILVTPVLAELILRRRRDDDRFAGVADRLTRGLSRWIASVAIGRPLIVLAVMAVLMAITVWSAGFVDQQFFPAADRATAVIDLQLAEGTHLEETDVMARRMERYFATRPDVLSVATFLGRGAPHFYYNLRFLPASPHRAQLVVETTNLAAVPDVIRDTRQFAQQNLPAAQVVARQLEQGPPIDAPVELRVIGDDFEDLEIVADQLLGLIREIPGSRDVRHDLGLGIPTVVFTIDDAAAARHGLSRVDVAQALAGRTLGLPAGTYRADDDPVPILVRSSAGETLPASALATIDVTPPGGDPVPLEQVARLGVEWRPAAIYHRDRERLVKVQAQLADGVTAAEVLDVLRPRLGELDVPPGVRVEVGGEAEESGAANAAILRAAPLGGLLLLFFLLAEFNSFRRVGIILVTVPLAAIGVVPGLLLSGHSFGFMALLGVVSLIGIVVNNAIVLLDVIETKREEGASVDEALSEAVQRRTRPILLTMATTVAGLSPLAFSQTSLWPPLAWAMISGLAASTVLTLLLVPALYRLIFGGRAMPRRQAVAATATALLLVMMAVPTPGVASEPSAEPPDTGVDTSGVSMQMVIDLDTALRRATERPIAQAANQRAVAAAAAADAARRLARFPIVGVEATADWRSENTEIDTPIGAFTLGQKDVQSLAVQITQPLLDPAQRFYRAPAAAHDATAAEAQAARIIDGLAAEAALAFLDILAIDAQLAATETFITSLEARLDETNARVDSGRALEADALDVRLDLESAELDRFTLRANRRVALDELERVTGGERIIDVRFTGPWDRSERPGRGALYQEALQERNDLRALNEQIQAAMLRADAIRAERLPRLEARGTYLRSEGDPFLPEDLAQGGLAIVWNPFAAGTRAPQRTALLAEHEALLAERTALERAIDVEIDAALARVRTARRAVAVRERGIELAIETQRVTAERSRAGRATTNDLLDAEAAVRAQRTARALADVDLLRAWISLDLAMGVIVP
ncbi:MAG: efflux RND transporter permease subunit [Acidobacteriota bacterium]